MIDDIVFNEIINARIEDARVEASFNNNGAANSWKLVAEQLIRLKADIILYARMDKM